MQLCQSWKTESTNLLSTSTCDDPLRVWSRRMCNLRQPIIIQVVYGVNVSPPTSTYLLSKSTCELQCVGVCLSTWMYYVHVSSLNVHLWVLTCRRLFIHLNVLRRRTLLLCRRIYFSCHIECRRICLVRRPVLFISTSVTAYVRISVDVHPKWTRAVSTYLLHTSTCIQWLCLMCRCFWFLCWL